MAVYTVMTKMRMMYPGYFLAEKALHTGWHIEKNYKKGINSKPFERIPKFL
jgi:hypothetical protein